MEGEDVNGWVIISIYITRRKKETEQRQKEVREREREGERPNNTNAVSVDHVCFELLLL